MYHQIPLPNQNRRETRIIVSLSELCTPVAPVLTISPWISVLLCAYYSLLSVSLLLPFCSHLSMPAAHFSLGELVCRYEQKMFTEKTYSSLVLRYQIHHNVRKRTAEMILYQRTSFSFVANLYELQIPKLSSFLRDIFSRKCIRVARGNIFVFRAICPLLPKPAESQRKILLIWIFCWPYIFAVGEKSHAEHKPGFNFIRQISINQNLIIQCINFFSVGGFLLW